MEFTEEQQAIIEKVQELLAPNCNEEVCYHTVYHTLKNADGDQIGEDTCTNASCIKAEKANIRSSIGKGKHLHEHWYSNDGDHDKIERCAICSTPLNSGLTWVESEFEYFERECEIEDEKHVVSHAFDINAIFYSLGWCVDKDETLPDRIILFAEKIIKILSDIKPKEANNG